MKDMENILQKKIGIVGCGEMGLPMLEVLLKNKISALGFDIRSKSEFSSVKENFLENKAEFFQKSEVIFSVVRDEKETSDLTEGEGGIFNLDEKKLFLICSTLSPRFIQDLRARAPKNIVMIDTPMSGASKGARAASLTFMVGSSEEEFEFISPLLKILGENIFHIGDFGTGMSIKVLNNFVTSATVAAVRQVLSQAPSLNLKPEKLLEIMSCSSGQTWFGSNFEKIEWSSKGHSAKNTIGILEKDVEAYQDALKVIRADKENLEFHEFETAILNVLRKLSNFNS